MAIVLVVTSVVYAKTTLVYAHPENKGQVLDKYKNMSTEEIHNKVKKLKKEDMLNETELMFSDANAYNTEELIPFATAFNERINEFSEEELEEIVYSDNNKMMKATVVQSYSKSYKSKSNEGKQSFRKLLTDKSTEVEVKENVIVLMDFNDKEGKSILKDLAVGDSDILAFQAIKKLKGIDNTTAVDISSDILDNYKNESTEKVNAALKVKADEYKNNRINKKNTTKDKQQKNEFIKTCKSIINDSEKEQKLKDSAIFALSDMTDIDAMNELINNSKIEEFYKTDAIYQNYYTLLSTLENDKSEDNITLICNAMEIIPINDFYTPLKEIASSDSYDKKLIKRVNSILTIIENEGVDSNPKFKSFYNDADDNNIDGEMVK